MSLSSANRRGRFESPWQKECLGKKGGFVALLFVIAMAISLSAFVFALTQSFSYTIMLLDAFRSKDNARSAAFHCYFLMVHAYELDAGYVPEQGAWHDAPYGASCRFVSYVASPEAKGFDVVTEGRPPVPRSVSRDSIETFIFHKNFRKDL